MPMPAKLLSSPVFTAPATLPACRVVIALEMSHWTAMVFNFKEC